MRERKHVCNQPEGSWPYRYENQLYNLLLDQLGRFDLNTLPEPPDLVRSRSNSLGAVDSPRDIGSARPLRTRLTSQNRTLALRQELVDSLRPVYENGGIAKFNYLILLMNFNDLNLRL